MSRTLVGQNPVHDHGINGQPEQAEIGKGPLRFLQYHLLRVGHQAHRGDLRIGQELVDAGQLAVERFQVLEVVFLGKGTPATVPIMGRTTFITRRSILNSLDMYHSSVVGMLTKRNDSPVGAQSSSITSNCFSRTY